VLEIPDSIARKFPALEPLDSFPTTAHDVLVHAPGFEDRTMAVASAITFPAACAAILLDYRPFNPKNRLGDVRLALTEQGVRISDSDVLLYDRFAPDHFEQRLRDRLIEHAASRVILDISTMSKLAILLILGVCMELDLEVVVVYTEALFYGPSKEEFEDARKNDEIHRPSIQIYTGVHGVVRVNSLASVAMQGQPTAAVVFMSFNDSLTQVLLNTVYPSRLFLINGRPPVHSWREEATAWIHDQVRHEWEEDNPLSLEKDGEAALPRRAVSTLDYRETVSLLIRLYWELSATHRLLLAPSGSKMQAVGCYLVKALHPDIHVEYPSPDGFLPEYSSGIAQRWVVNVGRIKALVESIAEQERREFLELAL
jgi:hypothetical protein